MRSILRAICLRVVQAVAVAKIRRSLGEKGEREVSRRSRLRREERLETVFLAAVAGHSHT